MIAFGVSYMLQDRSGNLAAGAISNIVNIVGGLLIYTQGTPVSLSVNISIDIATAKMDVSAPAVLS